MGEKKGDKKLAPPYGSYKTLANFLEKLMLGIPSRIDRSLMSSYSGVVQSQLFTTLKFLQLTTPQGIPTEKLKQLVHANAEQKKNILKEIFIASYPFIFKEGFDLKRTTFQHLQDEFQKAGASGGTTRKSISFFLSAAEDAGIELSPYIKVKETSPRRGAQKTKKTTGKKHSRQVGIGAKGQENTGQTQPKELDWKQLFLSKIPDFDPTWSDDVKAKWVEVMKELMGEFKKQEEE